MTSGPPLERARPVEGTAEPETFLPGNVAEGRQTFSPDFAKHELNLAKQQLTAEEQRHRLDEIAKDNASRRQRENVGFFAILGIVIVGLLASGTIGVSSANAATRDWAQDAFVLILGSVLGALAGYFTGKSGK